MNAGARNSYSLSELVERFGGEIIGDPSVRVHQVAPLEAATDGHLAFLSNLRYQRQLATTRASAVIVNEEAREATQLPRIVCANPYAYYARVCALLNPRSKPAPGIDPRAVVDARAKVAPSAYVGPCAVIEADATLGDGVEVHAGCFVGRGAMVGAESVLAAGVTVYHGCVIGARAMVHSGAVIGADGFGMAMDAGRWIKIPQIGRVVIGDDVEIGANTTIDRGAMADTVIEDDVKLDNQIQIGHNCRIGAHTAIAGCVGIAGSTRIGRYCRIGGSAMIGGHLEIADHVEISGGTTIAKSILSPGTYTSVFPVSPHEEWLKNASVLRHLRDLRDRVRLLEERLREMEKK
ncbi:MAG TPA: UDP-3-O-(3-hydroxymyristoyl)glucosamine N-acyltransferase [Burkholderiales bacterium]|jgi:UDP-3-O-[3-hydroxymyristoyl] glucosamine N-acyltransferase|nr:UDP-3-O-(3-hydroxymyristoyl)glucosamine N-acyltransferase [Burkholderiales bacterium]